MIIEKIYTRGRYYAERVRKPRGDWRATIFDIEKLTGFKAPFNYKVLIHTEWIECAFSNYVDAIMWASNYVK